MYVCSVHMVPVVCPVLQQPQGQQGQPMCQPVCHPVQGHTVQGQGQPVQETSTQTTSHRASTHRASTHSTHNNIHMVIGTMMQRGTPMVATTKVSTNPPPTRTLLNQGLTLTQMHSAFNTVKTGHLDPIAAQQFWLVIPCLEV